MGVMSCSRDSCPNIMCDTYVYEIGYVCNECQHEFKGYLNRHIIRVPQDEEIRTLLFNFLNTVKEDNCNEKNDKVVNEFFKRYTNNY